jgi:hypothetical protein
MYQHILIPTDGSDVGLAAVWHGSQTREVLTHSTLPTLVCR